MCCLGLGETWVSNIVNGTYVCACVREAETPICRIVHIMQCEAKRQIAHHCHCHQQYASDYRQIIRSARNLDTLAVVNNNHCYQLAFLTNSDRTKYSTLNAKPAPLSFPTVNVNSILGIANVHQMLGLVATNTAVGEVTR